MKTSIAVLAAVAALPAIAAEQAKAPEPFAFADFRWMNGNSRQNEFPLDGPVFSGQFTIETAYAYEFTNPKDHTVVGSTPIGRSNELQIVHLGVGGDFHWKGVRGRIMTQLGTYSTMTPRSDASTSRGQWSLDNAYRYISEGYGGYHFDVDSGLNIDAGILPSYVGLFSYYNYENWNDQASYSSSTPWFFNGVRIQWFPSDKLKIEPWIVNGWQSYGMFNEMPGFGLQIAYRPTGWLAMVASQYVGKDTLGNVGRARLHTDDSILVKYYQNGSTFLNQGALSLTVDLGCETGGGTVCFGGDKNTPAQYFAGFMLYNRWWFVDQKVGFTFGGGAMVNPGRYLVPTPPINGATAATGSAYFSQAKGDDYKAWDVTLTLDYMPSQFVTFRSEYTHRWANVAYFAGAGGITPPGGNSGAPGSAVPDWAPDLVQAENRLMFAILLRI